MGLSRDDPGTMVGYMGFTLATVGFTVFEQNKGGIVIHLRMKKMFVSKL